MEPITWLKDLIRNAEERERLLYAGVFFGLLFLSLGLGTYLHHRRVSFYKNQLKKIDTLRSKTKKILSDYQMVKAQQEKVEQLLAENKDFLIGEAYQKLVKRVGLSAYIKDETAPTTQETVSGKREVQISSNFSGISMKQVTDLLSQIANMPQLFTKELIIKKTPQAQSVDLDITIATLERA